MSKTLTKLLSVLACICVFNFANAQADGMVTLSVDMNQYTNTFTTVYLSGGFNGWAAADNPMTDNGDGTWSTTVMMPGGDNEYKFQLDQWAAEESFAEGDPCTVTNGGFTNRVVAVDGDATVGIECFNSCGACVAFVDGNVTLTVDMSEYTNAFTTVYLSGGFNGWAAADNPMTDNGDGTWSVTVLMPAGDNEYKFQLDQWAAEESFTAGDPCTVTGGGFTNRYLSVNGDASVGVNCFNSCDVCGAATDGMITLTVDVNEYPDPVTAVFLAGAFNGWSGDANPMTDNGDGTWTITQLLPAGDNEYKFVVDGAYEGFAGGESCTITSGGFTNRYLSVNGDATVDAVCYNSCSACGVFLDGMITFTVDVSEYTAAPVTGVSLAGSFNSWDAAANPMTDNGDGTWSGTVMLPGGDQEYKFVVNGSEYEEFAGGESCTVTNGGFTNRVVAVDGDATVDVVCYNSCAICSPPVDGMITLTVDVNEYPDPVTAVFLAGAFNGWSGDANPMTDNGDGTWTITQLLPAGDNEYKFVVDGAYEGFAGGESCTITSGGFTNRYLSVNGDATVDVVCYNSCFECGASVDGNVTLTVDMSEYTDPFTTMYLSGSYNGWSGDGNPMTDNGDGTWSITVLLPAGDNEYKFTIDNWAVQEEFMGGESCTITSGGFTNRLLNVNGDATVDAVCFNSCSACGVAPEGNITFNVDMSDYSDPVTQLYLSGSFNGWSPDANPMTDNGDGTWTITVLMPGGDQQYKFVVDGTYEEFAEGEVCTITDGGFTNRLVSVSGDATVSLVCFNSCEECDGLPDPEQCLTLDFEIPDWPYTLFGFGDVTATKIANPDASGLNMSANVLELVKAEAAQTWGGTAIPLDCFIDFSASTMMELHIWSPRADVPVLLKIEDTDSAPDMNGNPSVFAEIITNTSTSGAWELLMFDMSTFPDFNGAADIYDQVVVFADFGNPGVVGGETFYFDNIAVAGDVAIDETELAKVQLNAFPNPVDEVLNVNFDIPVAGNATLTLVDVLGRTAKHIDMDYVSQGVTTQEVAVNTLSSGTYVLLLRLDNQLIKTKNIVIK